mgnify:CR=1 FL=1
MQRSSVVGISSPVFRKRAGGNGGTSYDGIVVIIGGSGGNMHEILNKATNILRPNGRIVLTSVTAETTGEVVNEFKDRPFTFDGFQMQINRLRKLGRYHLFNPMSPILFLLL